MGVVSIINPRNPRNIRFIDRPRRKPAGPFRPKQETTTKAGGFPDPPGSCPGPTSANLVFREDFWHDNSGRSRPTSVGRRAGGRPSSTSRSAGMSKSPGAGVASDAVVEAREPGFFSRHPIGFWFFFWGELAERSSYYGMRAILTLYMTQALG